MSTLMGGLYVIHHFLTMEVGARDIFICTQSQKRIIWFFLGSQLIGPLVFIPYIGLIVALGLAAILSFYIYRMATAIGSWVPALWALASIVPILGMVPLLILNGMATKVLRDANIRVGLMGANQDDIASFAHRGYP